jgi:hypothetical protein
MLRPLVSGITGPVTALFILVAAETVLPKGSGSTLNLAPFYAISFIAGYREEVLTEALLKKTMMSIAGVDPDKRKRKRGTASS